MRAGVVWLGVLGSALWATSGWAQEGDVAPPEPACPPGAYCEEIEVPAAPDDVHEDALPSATDVAPQAEAANANAAATEDAPGVATPQAAPPADAEGPTSAVTLPEEAHPTSLGAMDRASYREGEPVPAGYAVVRRRRPGLVGTGVSMFATSFLVTAIVGGVKVGERGCAYVGCDPSWEYSPMFIPVVGPYVTLLTASPQDSATITGLLLSGAVQTSGMIMWIVGSASRDLELVRAAPVAVAPMIDGAAQGIAVQGRF